MWQGGRKKELDMLENVTSKVNKYCTQFARFDHNYKQLLVRVRLVKAAVKGLVAINQS